MDDTGKTKSSLLTLQKCMTIWYHMYGVSIGSLIVSIGNLNNRIEKFRQNGKYHCINLCGSIFDSAPMMKLTSTKHIGGNTSSL